MSIGQEPKTAHTEGVVTAELRLRPWYLLLTLAATTTGLATVLRDVGGVHTAVWTAIRITLLVSSSFLAGAAVLLAFPRGVRLAEAAGASVRTISLGEVRQFVLILAQVAAVVVFLAVFRLESPVLYERVMPLVGGAFIVNHLLPSRWRLGFFGLISVAAILLVFGSPQGLWVLGIGVALIAICHLPVSFTIRLVLLLATAAAMVAFRAAWLPTPWSLALWPVIGSMFMFRLIAYVYDLRHAKQRTSPAWPLAYFFCLPNVAFPLFPVIDFATFRRTYYDRPAFEIYQQGIGWMVRGVTHLVLYRLVYQYGTLSPADVDSLGDLVRYVLANFGLYLRVSGQFHLVVGLLHLFGFRLPETHRFFYLASSFTDFWRRINIYWKDFMQKVVFNPVYFPLRKRWGDTAGLVGATLLVFVATWFFHSYQWFWLLGTWLWSATDTLFWGILAVFLVGNVLRETKKGRVRALGAPAWTWTSALSLGARTAATFAVIALLWTLWTSPTLADFGALLAVDRVDGPGLFVLVGTLSGVGVAAIASSRWGPRALASSGSGTSRRIALGFLPLGVLWAAGTPEVSERLPVAAREVLRDVRMAELNRHDAAQLQRGYYENIVGVNRFNSQLWEVYGRKEREMPSLRELGVVRSVSDDRHTELAPLVGVVFQGEPLRTNSWGMRDREYELVAPANTYRVAILGQSYVMGMGVGDGQTFEAIVEERLNAARDELGGRRYELLNFAVPRYSLMQQLAMLQRGRVFPASPQAVALVGHVVDFDRILDYFEVQHKTSGLQVPLARELFDSAGVTTDMRTLEIQRRMQPYSPALVEWALQQIADEIRRHDARPVFALIPMPKDPRGVTPRQRLLTLARSAGFTVIDLSDVYRDVDQQALVVAEWDRHPNRRGHELIAEAFLPALVESLDLRWR